LHGKAGMIEKFVSGIMRDSRVFYRTEENFLDSILKQMQVETAQANAWIDADPDSIIKQAQERESKDGWPRVREALCTTARIWVAQAFILAMIGKDPAGAVSQHDNVIKLLELGTNVWKEQPYPERAQVLNPEFHVGVKVLWLNAYMMAYCVERDSGSLSNDRFPLSKLMDMTTRVIDSTKTNPFPPDLPGVRHDPGWISSFWVYAAAHAYSVQAFCHKEAGWLEEEKKAPDSPEKVADAFMKAALAYEEAGLAFPIDDEYRPYYLAFAVDCCWKVRTPMRMWWKLIPLLRTSADQMKQLWEFSQLSYSGRDDTVGKVLEYADQCQAKLTAGEITEEDQVYPDFSLNI